MNTIKTTKCDLIESPILYFDNDIISSLLGIMNSNYSHTVETVKMIEKKAIDKFWNLYKEGKISIVTSAETRRELEKHPDKYKNQEFHRLQYYNEVEKIIVTGGMKYGEYRYGEGLFGKSTTVEQIALIIPEHSGKEMDVKHIVNFIDNSLCREHHFFVTLDRHLLNAKDTLLEKFNVRINNPSAIWQKISKESGLS